MLILTAVSIQIIIYPIRYLIFKLLSILYLGVVHNAAAVRIASTWLVILL